MIAPTVFLTDVDGSELNATRSSVQLKNSTLSQNLLLNQGNLKLLKSTVTKNVEVASSTDQSETRPSVLFYNPQLEKKLTSKAAKSFVGYTDLIRHGYFEGKAHIVGNEFDGRGNFAQIGVDLQGGDTMARISNNLIVNFSKNETGNLQNRCIGIRVDQGAKAQITNNFINNCLDGHGSGNNSNVGMVYL